MLALYPNSAMGQWAPTKLHMHGKGPIRVISNQWGAEYLLLNLVQNKQISIRNDNMEKLIPK